MKTTVNNNNMKKVTKFKLIKRYPFSSYDIDDVIDTSKTADPGYTLRECLNSPDHWQPVSGTDFKIENEGTPQVKVTRLCDGKSFKIDDMIDAGFGNKLKITDIKSFDNELNIEYIAYTTTEYEGVITNNKLTGLFKDIVKLEKLFTTHDGVDIFEGDDCYEVFTSSGKKKIAHVASRATRLLKENLDKGERLAFSTYQAAEEFIHKYRIITISDIIENYNGKPLFNEDDLFNFLKTVNC